MNAHYEPLVFGAVASLSAPALVRRAAGLEPFGTETAKADMSCALCGAHIPVGSRYTPRKATSIDSGSFMDHAYMADRYAPVICEDCQPLMTKDFLQKYSSALVTAEGLFKLSSNEEIASFLLSPPDVPFVVTLSNAKQQHVFWRAPLNLSRKKFRIQFGPSVYGIRHDKLMEATDLQWRLLDAYAIIVSEGKKKVRSGYSSAIRIPDRKMKAGGAYSILANIVEIAGETGEFLEFEAAVNGLLPGEIWALATIGFSKLREPVPLTRLLSPVKD